MDEARYNRLKGLWDGQSQYVMDGTAHFIVQTPNGPEAPVFVPMQEGFGDTSTGFLQAPEPPAKTKSAPKPKTKTKTATKPAPSSSVTDVPKEGE